VRAFRSLQLVIQALEFLKKKRQRQCSKEFTSTAAQNNFACLKRKGEKQGKTLCSMFTTWLPPRRAPPYHQLGLIVKTSHVGEVEPISNSNIYIYVWKRNKRISLASKQLSLETVKIQHGRNQIRHSRAGETHRKKHTCSSE